MIGRADDCGAVQWGTTTWFRKKTSSKAEVIHYTAAIRTEGQESNVLLEYLHTLAGETHQDISQAPPMFDLHNTNNVSGFMLANTFIKVFCLTSMVQLYSTHCNTAELIRLNASLATSSTPGSC